MDSLLARLGRVIAHRDARTPRRHLPEVVALVIAVTAVPMVAGWVPPNPYYGFRTPATMATEQAWYVANRLMGFWMIASQAAALLTMSRVSAAMQRRFGKDRVTWGVLWSCLTALAGIGSAVLHYYAVG